jgi:hypothetical protein
MLVSTTLASGKRAVISSVPPKGLDVAAQVAHVHVRAYAPVLRGNMVPTRAFSPQRVSRPPAEMSPAGSVRVRCQKLGGPCRL